MKKDIDELEAIVNKMDHQEEGCNVRLTRAFKQIAENFEKANRNVKVAEEKFAEFEKRISKLEATVL